MLKKISEVVSEFKSISRGKNIRIISHYDTDGITAAAIMIKALNKQDLKFKVNIIRQLEVEFIEKLKKEITKDELIMFLDLGSSNIIDISELNVPCFILDHHEVPDKRDIERIIDKKNMNVVNSTLHNEETSGAGLAYFFAKELNEKNKELSYLAVIGMVGDVLGSSLSRINNLILNESEVIVKRALTLFSATRPIHKSLEFSSDFYIPGVTGNSAGAISLLREAGIPFKSKEDKTVLDLSEEETSRLLTAIMLRRINCDDLEKELVGNVYLLRFFSKLEDIREISSKINACSRQGHSDIAISFCLGDKKAYAKSEKIHATYKHEIIHGLKWISENKHIEGEGFVLINAKNNIKDGIIGTALSIISASKMYPKNTILIGMAHQQDKIKVSLRNTSRNKDINLQEIIRKIYSKCGGEGGGHPQAAGCIIPLKNEDIFVKEILSCLKNELVKVRV
jgi:RecJ-like exonuclease